MNIAALIQNKVHKKPLGKPFSTSTLSHYGTRAAVDQALSRMVKAGKLMRVTRGIYVRPETNKYVGLVQPEAMKVAKAMAKKTGETIEVSFVEAARQFGFTTQVSAHPTFITTGRSHQFKIAHLPVHLKHVSKKKLPFPGKKYGLAILALWHIGKDEAKISHIKKIQKKISKMDFEKFINAKHKMPIWMTKLVLQYEKEKK